MATYSITFSEEDDWGEAENRFKMRQAVDERFDELRAAGCRFARLVKWADNQAKKWTELRSSVWLSDWSFGCWFCRYVLGNGVADLNEFVSTEARCEKRT